MKSEPKIREKPKRPKYLKGHGLILSRMLQGISAELTLEIKDQTAWLFCLILIYTGSKTNYTWKRVTLYKTVLGLTDSNNSGFSLGNDSNNKGFWKHFFGKRRKCWISCPRHCHKEPCASREAWTQYLLVNSPARKPCRKPYLRYITHSLIHHFETVPNSKKLQTTTETWLLTHYHTMLHFDALKIYSCGKHCEERRNCL